MTITEEFQNLKRAVTNKCIDCVGGEENKEEIKKCPIESCPLYAFRPQRIRKPKDVGES